MHNASSDKHTVAIFDMGEAQGPSKDLDKKKLKAKLELGEGCHKSNITSVLWEDCEYSEGFTAKELISADSDSIVIWDLMTAQVKVQIESSQIGSDLSECTVVKRDPHHKNLICVGIENGFYQVDLRSPLDRK